MKDNNLNLENTGNFKVAHSSCGCKTNVVIEKTESDDNCDCGDECDCGDDCNCEGDCGDDCGCN